MLDEPSAGLNREEMRQLIAGDPAAQRRPASPILLVSHDMELMAVAEDVHVLNFGEIIAKRQHGGDPAERERPRSVSRGLTMLEVHSLMSGYGALTVLHDVSLSIGDREAVAIVGANGAGKTTLVRTICGLLRARSGRILKNGVDISRTPAHELVRAPHRRRAGEPPPVRRADGAREPAARGAGRSRRRPQDRVRLGATSTRCSR